MDNKKTDIAEVYMLRHMYNNEATAAARNKNGLGPLTIDNRLVAAALQHSQDQANNCKMTHVGSSRSKVGYRIQAQGYRFATAAENVAAGQKTVEQVIISWWNSPGHRANLLNRNVKSVGFENG
ncbi:unnamed protein product [Peronospora belbahrii]|uniref:SCP domain-containing protein n=1 Tax=Peronospora belbahrii TaxID=622444 RepID=A0ABN8CNI5_9STRA|nr:unnamed protein product [Peronospora belbahrii]